MLNSNHTEINQPIRSLDPADISIIVRRKEELPQIQDGIYDFAIQEIRERKPAPKQREPEREREARSAQQRPEAAGREKHREAPVRKEEETRQQAPERSPAEMQTQRAAERRTSERQAPQHQQPRAKTQEQNPQPAAENVVTAANGRPKKQVRPHSRSTASDLAIGATAGSGQAKQKEPSRKQSSERKTDSSQAAQNPPAKKRETRAEQPRQAETREKKKVVRPPQQKPAQNAALGEDDEEATCFMGAEVSKKDPVLKDLTTGENIRIDRTPFVIGKSSSCDYEVHAKVVSRQHAEIRQSGDKVFIKDLNSTNGTFVNGFPLPPDTEMELKPGQEIILANRKFIIRW